MKTFASITFLLANLGLLVWAQTSQLTETHFNSAEGREFEVMRVFADFEDAKFHKNETKFAQVLVRVKQLKDSSKDLADKIQHRIAVSHTEDVFWGRIEHEMERIRLYKQDQALDVVAYEILAHQANITDFVERFYSEGVEAVLLLESNKLEKPNKDGLEIQKSIEAAYSSLNNGSSVDAALIEKIYQKLDTMIKEAAEYRRDVLSVYETEMFKLAVQANKDLSLTQKYYVSLITGWTTYNIDYVKSYQEVFKLMFAHAPK